MRAFAKAFYESPAWRSTRAYIIKRDAGLCVRCGALGAIVHHKRPLTPDNIDDPLVSLNEKNLETLWAVSRIAVNWWLRSPNRSNSTNFVNVNTDGTVNNANANNSLAFAPGFRTGQTE